MAIPFSLVFFFYSFFFLYVFFPIMLTTIYPNLASTFFFTLLPHSTRFSTGVAYENLSSRRFVVFHIIVSPFSGNLFECTLQVSLYSWNALCHIFIIGKGKHLNRLILHTTTSLLRERLYSFPFSVCQSEESPLQTAHVKHVTTKSLE